MSDRELSALLAGRERERLPVGDGTELRLLSAFEILEAGREAAALAARERERPCAPTPACWPEPS